MLNRIDDKGGQKLCMDLLKYDSKIENLSLSSNSLGQYFCEKLSEYLKMSKYIRRMDISCNFIDNSNASTLKDSIIANPNIIELDIRNNRLTDDVEL